MTPEERDQLVADIAAAVRIRNTDVGLSEDEQRWVRLAIKKEAQSIAFRQAIIEKGLGALLAAAVIALAGMFGSWFWAHFYKS